MNTPCDQKAALRSSCTSRTPRARHTSGLRFAPTKHWAPTQRKPSARRAIGVRAARAGVCVVVKAWMGDKSPKAKQREKNQKDAARTRAKSEQFGRQTAFTSNVGKEKKK